jgi:hypothetical protein
MGGAGRSSATCGLLLRDPANRNSTIIVKEGGTVEGLRAASAAGFDAGRHLTFVIFPRVPHVDVTR